MKTDLDCYPCFLCQAKCSVIAGDLGIDEGSIILKQQKSALTAHV